MNIQLPSGKKLRSLGLTLLAATIGLASLENVKSGEYVRYQKPSGTHEWFTSPGIKFVIPLMSTLTTYHETTTVAFSDSEDTRNAASLGERPAVVKFADGYTGSGEFTFRFSLSPDPIALEQMHIAVKNQKNLIGNTMLPAAISLLNQTANQFTGSVYSQGGKGQFEERLIDQARNGLLNVKRVRKEIESVVADQGTNDRASNKTAKVYEYVFEIKENANGLPIRRQLDIKDYGIKFAQVTMGNFQESPELSQFLSDRRTKERERVNRINEQNVERENAITTALRGETARIQAKNKALMVKDAAVVAEQQKVAVEKEKANLSVVQKNKELAIAKANEGIQKANATAAKYEAQAITEKGFAEAAVKKADYAAVDKDVLAMEVDRAKSLALYRTNMVVNMPTIVGGGEGSSSLDTMTSLKVLESLGSPVK